MNLPPERMTVIRQGPAIDVTERDVPVVVLRADLCERLRSLAEDDTVYTTSETLDEVMAAADPFLVELRQKYPLR